MLAKSRTPVPAATVGRPVPLRIFAELPITPLIGSDDEGAESSFSLTRRTFVAKAARAPACPIECGFAGALACPPPPSETARAPRTARRGDPPAGGTSVCRRPGRGLEASCPAITRAMNRRRPGEHWSLPAQHGARRPRMRSRHQFVRSAAGVRLGGAAICSSSVVPAVRLGGAATSPSAGCARMPDIHRRAADRSRGDDFNIPSQFQRSGLTFNKVKIIKRQDRANHSRKRRPFRLLIRLEERQ